MAPRYSVIDGEVSRRQAVEIAESILGGRRGICDECRALKALAYDLVSDWREDPDFVVFGGVDFESDDFPLGDVRSRLLATLDVRRERYEAKVREVVLAACRSVVDRFGGA